MTILIEGRPLSRLPDSVNSLYKDYPALKNEAVKLANGPVQQIDSTTDKVLYVTQKEYAVIKKNDDRINIVGSDDATTCHILVLEHPENDLLCLAHIDSADNLESLTKMVVDVLDSTDDISSTTLELSLFGGYVDDKMQSENLTLDLLAFYHQLPVKIRLKTACLGSANTSFRDGLNWPIIYGIAINLQPSVSMVPASFGPSVRGPLLALRSARLFCTKDSLYRVYHSRDGKFTIEPFEYRYPRQISEWLHKSDDYVRNNFSTSPAVEPAHFAREIKQVFQFVAQNPFPMHSVFKSKEAILFQLSPTSGQWHLI